jgi:hypothetical protein
VPCPHLSSESSECLLLQEAEADDEERGAAPIDEPPNREWCLSSDKKYRQCPLYRRFLAELQP